MNMLHHLYVQNDDEQILYIYVVANYKKSSLCVIYQQI